MGDSSFWRRRGRRACTVYFLATTGTLCCYLADRLWGREHPDHFYGRITDESSASEPKASDTSRLSPRQPALVSLFGSDAPSTLDKDLAPVPSDSCVDCDVVDIQLPSTSTDWNLEGACPLPRKSGNAFQIAELLLERSHERCFEGACSTWIAYIGDSLLRSPFNHLIDVLLGRDWPPGGDRGVFNLTTYHVDRRVCCTVRDDAEETDVNHLQCEFTRAFKTVEYVHNFFQRRAVKAAEERGTPLARNICITWQWNRLADADLLAALANYTAKPTRSPQLIVINPGLHVILSQVPIDMYDDQVGNLLTWMKDVANAQRQNADLVPTRFVFQDITSLIDEQIPDSKRALMNESSVLRFNERLHQRLDSAIQNYDSKQWLRVVHAHRITAAKEGAAKGLVTPRGDGVHYAGGYSNIVAQLHLIFMDPNAPQRFCRPY